MKEDEIKEYLKRVDELELKLTGEDKDTYQWLLFGYNECTRLLNEKEEVIKEARETIKTKLQKSFAYDYGLSGVDATGKDRLFTETVIELQLIDKILSKGENK